MYKAPKPHQKIGEGPVDPKHGKPVDPKHPTYYKEDSLDNKPATKVAPTSVTDDLIVGPVPHKHAKPKEDGEKKLDRVFEWIQKAAADRLHRLNYAIVALDDPATPPLERAQWQIEYDAAVDDYNQFVEELNTQTSDAFKGKPKTINWATFDPVMVGNLYSGVKIIVRWLGGSHSDASGVLIPHNPP